MDVINALEVRVVGMSRSGNHAIIDWILAQASGRTCFLNCAEAGHSPFATARPLSDGGPAHRVSFEGFDPEAERCGRHAPKDLLLHSYEDTFLRALQREVDVGTSARRVDVLVLRDPYNLVASRRASGVGHVSESVALRIWCQHAREFLGERRHLGPDRLPVSYNRWVAEPAYRRAIAERLGLRHDDRSLRRVPACAGGSSFDGVAFHGRAQEMGVLERWRAFGHEPSYLRLFTSEVRALAERAFATGAALAA